MVSACQLGFLSTLAAHERPGGQLTARNCLRAGQNDEWAVTRRYMSLETVAQVCEDQTIDVAKTAAF